MKASTFWKAVVVDRENFLERFLHTLNESGMRYCLIGGQAVNAYVEPLVTLDLDIVVAAEGIEPLVRVLSREFTIKRFPNSINVSARESKLRVQIQTDLRYLPFLDRAEIRSVLDYDLPVAHVEDVLQGKVWAALDPERRSSKKLKDLTDIARLIETSPKLRERVPAEVLKKIDSLTW